MIGRLGDRAGGGQALNSAASRRRVHPARHVTYGSMETPQRYPVRIAGSDHEQSRFHAVPVTSCREWGFFALSN